MAVLALVSLYCGSCVMRFAFFSDDTGAALAAVLTAHALAIIDRAPILVQVVPEGVRSTDLVRPLRGGLDVVRIPAGRRAPAMLDGLFSRAKLAERDVVAALPLAMLDDPAVSAASDLRVVPVGHGSPASPAVTGVARPDDGLAAPWVLASDVEARGHTDHARAHGWTDEGMLLPVAMPALGGTQVSVVTGCHVTGPGMLRRAVLLAAAVVAASVDPRTPLDRIAFADLMASGPAAGQASGILAALAAEYDRLTPDDRERPTTRPCARRAQFPRTRAMSLRDAAASGSARESVGRALRA